MIQVGITVQDDSDHAHRKDEDREEEVFPSFQHAVWMWLKVIHCRQSEEQHL